MAAWRVKTGVAYLLGVHGKISGEVINVHCVAGIVLRELGPDVLEGLDFVRPGEA